MLSLGIVLDALNQYLIVNVFCANMRPLMSSRWSIASPSWILFAINEFNVNLSAL